MNDVDLVALTAVIMGTLIVLIPIAGITARMALKPTVEAIARFFEVKGDQETVQLLERRIALLEQQVEGMERSVQRIEAAEEFDRRLRTGRAATEGRGESAGTGSKSMRAGDVPTGGSSNA